MSVSLFINSIRQLSNFGKYSRRRHTPGPAQDITYDANGNILTMRRYGADGSLEADFGYRYSGNRLTGLDDGSFSEASFTYDPNGNLISDTRSGIISASYNELNLPQSVTFAGGEAEYLYLSDGTKLAALKDGSGLIYCGSMVYSCTFSGTAPAVDFESTEFSAGRMVKKAFLTSCAKPSSEEMSYKCVWSLNG